jgi:acetyltransferase-like isoleucine patch superfamily enzyme
MQNHATVQSDVQRYTDDATQSGRIELGSRSLREDLRDAPNAHRRWYTARNETDGALWGPTHIVLNYLTIYACKHLPSLTIKRMIFRALGMRLGRNVTIASGVTLDYFFPELIEIGENTIVGMDAMILTHEFLHDRLRTGKVTIGRNTLVGAQSMILAGVTVGAGAKISAMSLVHKSVPIGAFVGGNPLRILRHQ